ncbi:hypothetical protein LJC23_00255 [Desulfovibrio sp. OttesenSCG-928-I05]|nr:hypothetical protein [Desulfovibrio sp. OttesenSCG-928-I05]
MLLLAASCVPSGVRLYPGVPVPAVVYDGASLEYFYALTPIPAPAVRVRVTENGLVEPGGPTVPGDYLPESFSREIAARLDLRSFPSLLALPAGFGALTHQGRGWDAEYRDERSCSFASGIGTCTYTFVASFDYTGDGLRDWLFVSSQQVPAEDAPMLILWLLAESPMPGDDLLAVRLLGFEERYGIGGSRAVMNAAEVPHHIAALRGKLGLQ